MKPLSRSHTLWSAAGIAAITAALTVISTATAVTVGDWIRTVALAIVTGLGIYAGARRIGDKRADTAAKAKAKRAALDTEKDLPPVQHLQDRPSRPSFRRGPYDERGFVSVGTLQTIGLIALVVSVVLAFSGCSTWPSACKRDMAGIYQCDCDSYELVAHTRSKRVEQLCNGQPMPIQVRGKSLKLPVCEVAP